MGKSYHGRPHSKQSVNTRAATAQCAVQTLLPYVKSGQLVAIAVGEPQRMPSLPDLPTVAELCQASTRQRGRVSLSLPGRRRRS